MPTIKINSWRLQDAIEAYPLSERNIKKIKNLHDAELLASNYEHKMLILWKQGRIGAVRKYWHRAKSLNLQDFMAWNWEERLSV